MNSNIELNNLDSLNSIEVTTQALKEEFEHYSTIEKSLFSSLRSELDSAHQTIEKLKADKSKLKSAFKESLQKKNELFKEVCFLQKQLRISQIRNTELLSQQSSVQKDLQSIDTNTQSYEKSNKEMIKDTILSIISATKQKKSIYPLLKEEIGCKRFFESTIDTKDLDLSIIKVLAFAEKLVTVYEDSQQGRNFEKVMSASNDLMNILPFQIGRVSRLNEEMVNALERSKQLLGNSQNTKELSGKRNSHQQGRTTAEDNQKFSCECREILQYSSDSDVSLVDQKHESINRSKFP